MLGKSSETTIYTQWGLFLEFIVRNVQSKYLTFDTIYWKTVGAMGSYSRDELSGFGHVGHFEDRTVKVSELKAKSL